MPFPKGIDVIERGECKEGAFNPHSCIFCPYGHMLECHYPMTCREAHCQHGLANLEVEDADL